MEQLVVLHGPDAGTMDKISAHKAPGFLHEAFSVLLLDGDRTLLQRRAATKYHFPGLWTNACCSHPLTDVVAEAQARLLFEVGIEAALEVVGSFTYRATDPVSGLVEHEHDTVLVGHTSATGNPNPDEVSELRWVALADLRAEMAATPEVFTPWFAGVLDCYRSRS